MKPYRAEVFNQNWRGGYFRIRAILETMTHWEGVYRCGIGTAVLFGIHYHDGRGDWCEIEFVWKDKAYKKTFAKVLAVRTMKAEAWKMMQEVYDGTFQIVKPPK